MMQRARHDRYEMGYIVQSSQCLCLTRNRREYMNKMYTTVMITIKAMDTSTILWLMSSARYSGDAREAIVENVGQQGAASVRRSDLDVAARIHILYQWPQVRRNFGRHNMARTGRSTESDTSVASKELERYPAKDSWTGTRWSLSDFARRMLIVGFGPQGCDWCTRAKCRFICKADPYLYLYLAYLRESEEMTRLPEK
jgi:hypothetical protein